MRKNDKEFYANKGLSIFGVFASPVAVNTASTCIATVADRLLLNPLDAVIVTQQVTKQKIPKAVSSIYRESGVVGFYRGMSWPLVLSVPGRLAAFSTYYSIRNGQYLSSKGYTDFQRAGVAASISGLTYTVVTSPSEAKLIRRVMRVNLGLSDYDIRALYSGVSATALRNTLSMCIMFPSSEFLTRTYKANFNQDTKIVPFFAGAVSGLTAQVAVTPIDVVKTRMMCDVSRGSFVKHARNVIKSRDPFVSVGLRSARIGLGSGIMIGTIGLFNDHIEKLANIAGDDAVTSNAPNGKRSP